MKRLLWFCLVVILILPAQGVFAQEPAIQDFGGNCAPDGVLDDLLNELGYVSGVDDLPYFLEYSLGKLVDCGATWLEDIMELVIPFPISNGFPDGFGESSAGEATVEVMPAYNPDDGFMSAAEAEYVIETIFSGDLATGNPYLCEDDQIAEDDLASIGNFTLNSVVCANAGLDTLECTIDATFDGTTDVSSTTFDIIDGKLCEQN